MEFFAKGAFMIFDPNDFQYLSTVYNQVMHKTDEGMRPTSEARPVLRTVGSERQLLLPGFPGERLLNDPIEVDQV